MSNIRKHRSQIGHSVINVIRLIQMCRCSHYTSTPRIWVDHMFNRGSLFFFFSLSTSESRRFPGCELRHWGSSIRRPCRCKPASYCPCPRNGACPCRVRSSCSPLGCIPRIRRSAWSRRRERIIRRETHQTSSKVLACVALES